MFEQLELNVHTYINELTEIGNSKLSIQLRHSINHKLLILCDIYLHRILQKPNKKHLLRLLF